MIAVNGNMFPARKTLPDPQAHDVMAGFLTYRLGLWPPSQNKFQWHLGLCTRLTVTGIALDLHQLPS